MNGIINHGGHHKLASHCATRSVPAQNMTASAAAANGASGPSGLPVDYVPCAVCCTSMLPVPVAGACKRGRAQDMLRCLQLRVPGMWTMRAHIAQTKGRARERERETKGIRPIRMRAMCQRGNTPAADRHKFSSALSCVCPRCTLNSLRAAVPVRGRRDQRSEIVALVDRLCFSLGAIKGLESG